MFELIITLALAILAVALLAALLFLVICVALIVKTGLAKLGE